MNQGTYQLQLQLTIPITNPNYVSARIDGNVSVAFYDADAGRGLLERAVVPRRAEPYALLLAIDASNVPDAYTFVSHAAADESSWGGALPVAINFFVSRIFTYMSH